MMINDRRRLIGNLFMAAGLLLVLGAATSILWPQYQGERLRAQLLAEQPSLAPRVAVAATAEATATLQDPAVVSPEAAALTTAPDITKAAPSATPGPAIVATPVVAAGDPGTPTAEPSATAQPTPTPGRATPGITAVATVTPVPTHRPTATRTATATSPAAPTPGPSPTALPPNLPVRIVIPDLQIDVPVQEMGWQMVQTATGSQAEWQIPEYAGGHATNSAPLGVPGNLVISGHNNIYGRVFMNISQAWGGTVESVDAVTERSHLLDGHVIKLYAADGREFDYLVTDFLRVHDSGVPLAQRIANAQYIAQTDDTRVTVTTCWPPWSNTYRLIVIAHPVQ